MPRPVREKRAPQIECKGTASRPVDPWTGKPIMVALCPHGKPSCSLKANGSVKDHPGWSKFLKKYPDAAAWIRDHVGKVAGRCLHKAAWVKNLVYFKYRLVNRPGRQDTGFTWNYGDKKNLVQTMIEANPNSTKDNFEIVFFPAFAEWHTDWIEKGTYHA